MIRSATRWSVLVWLIITHGALGCTAKSSYVRTQAKAGEIVWAYDGVVEATQEGRIVGKVGDWSGLADAVKCVDRARVFAAAAEQDSAVGNALSTTAWVALFATPFLATGVAVLPLVLAPKPSDGEVTAATVALSTVSAFTVGVVGWGSAMLLDTGGAALKLKATPEAIDAVNVYNDSLASPSCRDSSSTGSVRNPSP